MKLLLTLLTVTLATSVYGQGIGNSVQYTHAGINYSLHYEFGLSDEINLVADAGYSESINGGVNINFAVTERTYGISGVSVYERKPAGRFGAGFIIADMRIRASIEAVYMSPITGGHGFGISFRWIH